jgi:hypothetical protein
MSFSIVNIGMSEAGLSIRRALPPTPAELIEKIRALERKLIGKEPVDVPTEHVIHGGMYVRTIAMPPGMVLSGCLLKVPTIVTVAGSAAVLAGDEWLELEGFNVIPGCVGRKQLFVSHSTVIISMVFRTAANTVEGAEAEMTDEADQLLSRRQNANNVVITGE